MDAVHAGIGHVRQQAERYFALDVEVPVHDAAGKAVFLGQDKDGLTIRKRWIDYRQRQRRAGGEAAIPVEYRSEAIERRGITRIAGSPAAGEAAAAGIAVGRRVRNAPAAAQYGLV